MSPIKPERTHPWNLAPAEAVRLQQELRDLVVIEPLPLDMVKYVAGVDVGFRDENTRAAVVILSYPSLQLVEHSVAEIPTSFPYIPGLLSFREIPAVLVALEKIKTEPDVLICDGQGLAHPRRFGIASHLGVLINRPTLGCAKSILVGKYGPLDEAAGSVAELTHRGEVIGAVVRTREKVKPVIVSIGHRVDLASAVELILACGRGYKLPEPTRLADRLASERGPLPGPGEQQEKLF